MGQGIAEAVQSMAAGHRAGTVRTVQAIELNRYWQAADRIADRLTRHIRPRTSYVDSYRRTL